MLAIIETHPIQYHAPVYGVLQQQYGVPVTVVYGSDFSVAGYDDAEFGVRLAWDTELLAGYSSIFLSRVSSGGARDAAQVSSAGIGSALRRLRPSAVLIVGYSPLFHGVAWWEAWRSRYSVLFRGEANDDARARHWLKTRARSWALAHAYRTCSRILFIGQRAREHYRRLGVPDERLVFSPYCIAPGPFEADEVGRARLRAEGRRALDITDDKRVVLFSGKLSERKGPDLLLWAAKQLDASVRDRVVVVFLGDGAMRQTLTALASAEPAIDVRFAGFRNQGALSRYYHAADLLTLPSRSGETWGLVVNEALHHGVPCVVSDAVGCAPDLIEPGRTGEVFTAGSVMALSAALQSVLGWSGDEALRNRCRHKTSEYGIDRAAQGIAEAYFACQRERGVRA